MITDQVIANSGETLTTRLLREPDLTLAKTLDIARCIEVAHRQASDITNDSTDSSTNKTPTTNGKAEVNYVKQNFQNWKKKKFSTSGNNKYTPTYSQARHQPSSSHKPQLQGKQKASQLQCGRCGMIGHTSKLCRVARDKYCNNCGLIGHFATVCRTKKTQERGPKNKQPWKTTHRVNTLTDQEDIEDEDYVWAVGNQHHYLMLPINGIKYKFIIDSGATVNLMDEKNIYSTWI